MGSTVGELKLIPIALIDVPRMRIRHDLRAVEELAYSIASVGLLHPIQVYRLRVRYRLVAGERRLRAAQLLGWTEVHAFVRDRSDDDLLLELVENTQRKWLTDAEEADALIRLVREKRLELKEVAAQVGRSEAYVSKRLRLFEDPLLRNAIENGQMTVSATEELLGLQPAQRAALLADAIAGGWDSMRVREAVRALTNLVPVADVAPPQTGPQAEPAPEWADDESVLEGSFREVEGYYAMEELGGRPGSQPSERPTDLTRQIRTLSKTLREMRAYELTPADERALASLLDALLALARAHSRSGRTGGPAFPSLEEAELAVRHAKRRYPRPE